MRAPSRIPRTRAGPQWLLYHGDRVCVGDVITRPKNSLVRGVGHVAASTPARSRAPLTTATHAHVTLHAWRLVRHAQQIRQAYDERYTPFLATSALYDESQVRIHDSRAHAAP